MVENKDSYITIEVDEDIYNDLLLWCKENNTTPEEIAEQFIRFVANPDNKESVIKWYEQCCEEGLV